jgi:hypothetical protein
MLLSVGPILGEGRLIGFTGTRGFLGFVSYRRGMLFAGGFTDSAPLTLPDLAPPPLVAVLIDAETVSSGEAVAVAFRGRPRTRSFGSSTAGASTSAGRFRLVDGAEIQLGVAYDVDRNRVVYRHGLKPDVHVDLFGSSGDPQLRAAADWLVAERRCTHPRRGG